MRLRPITYVCVAALLLLTALLTVFALRHVGREKVAGTSWERVSRNAPVFAGKDGRAAVNAVVAGGPGLVAVGFQSANAAVWTSKDGLAWKRVPNENSVFGGSGVEGMSAVTAGGPGLVAVGGDEVNGNWDAAVWTSRDGFSWTRRGAAAAVFGGGGDQLMRSVVSAGPGLVAVGSDNGDAAVWTSKDGLSWTRVSAAGTVFGGNRNQGMNAVTATERGLVAVGFDDGNAAVWRSRNGLAWTRVGAGRPAFGGAGDQKMYSVAAGGPGLVAVGYDYGGAAVWTSTDGVSWKHVPTRESGSGGVVVWSEMLGVVAGGPGLVAVGVVGTGVGGSDAAVWTSKDGLSWKGVPDRGPVFGFEGNQALAGVTTGGPGLVAVGDDRNAAAVWTSRR